MGGVGAAGVVAAVAAAKGTLVVLVVAVVVVAVRQRQPSSGAGAEAEGLADWGRASAKGSWRGCQSGEPRVGLAAA